MLGCWNQMAEEIYNSFSEAWSDFRATEGGSPYERLIEEIQALHDAVVQEDLDLGSAHHSAAATKLTPNS